METQWIRKHGGLTFEGMTKSAIVMSSAIFSLSMWLGCLGVDRVVGLPSFSLYPYHKFS